MPSTSVAQRVNFAWVLDPMADRNYLEEFVAEVAGDLSKRLVAIFVEGHRDPATKPIDLVTRLKEEMEEALHGMTDAPD